MAGYCVTWIVIFLFGTTSALIGDVRLADGRSSRDGRLEIYLTNDRGTDMWGTVCSTGWGSEEAEVACRQLGNDGVNRAYYHAPTSSPYYYSHVTQASCIGNEAKLIDCDLTYYDGGTHCYYLSVVAIDCYSLVPDPSAKEGEIRLSGSSSTPTYGLLQIYHDNSWGSVCRDGWYSIDSQVACRELGYQTGSGSSSFWVTGEFFGPIYLTDVGCTGDEVALSLCPHGGWGNTDCGHEWDIYLDCTPDFSGRYIL
ncbi:neurotrypsin-like [Diadema antillarum]|uniref:neurotrypsin-like n=1 Tax=Diadema antillarum TaxID=105358 RepID=UPI003A8903ED